MVRIPRGASLELGRAADPMGPLVCVSRGEIRPNVRSKGLRGEVDVFSEL